MLFQGVFQSNLIISERLCTFGLTTVTITANCTPCPLPEAFRTADVHSPSENQTEQGADEDEHLVEHGRVRPLDGTMEIILGKESTC